MKNKLSVFKRLDLFAEPVRLRTTRASATKPTLFYGSWIGFSISMTCIISLMSYMGYAMVRMSSGGDDV